jgi:ribosome-binding factor A
MASFRIEKINELIRQKIAEIFVRELSLKPGVFVTIAKVDTTKDLRYTRVFISIFPETEQRYVTEALRRELGEIQGKLNKQLNMKPLPKIDFLVDATEIRADEVEKILRDLKAEKKE